jgi:orotate phosphoribosyltransferase
LNRGELAARIFRISHLTGSFTLRSGAEATEYFDKYRFESDPALLREIAVQLAPLVPAGTEILAGLEMGGIPIVTALSAETGIPAVFVRKKPKDYGTCLAVEGRDVAGATLCVVEDVISSGGQVVLSTNDLRDAGGVVDNVLCVIDRRPADADDVLAQAGLKLHALFTMAELKTAGGA